MPSNNTDHVAAKNIWLINSSVAVPIPMLKTENNVIKQQAISASPMEDFMFWDTLISEYCF